MTHKPWIDRSSDDDVLGWMLENACIQHDTLGECWPHVYVLGNVADMVTVVRGDAMHCQSAVANQVWPCDGYKVGVTWEQIDGDGVARISGVVFNMLSGGVHMALMRGILDPDTLHPAWSKTIVTNTTHPSAVNDMSGWWDAIQHEWRNRDGVLLHADARGKRALIDDMVASSSPEIGIAAKAWEPGHIVTTVRSWKLARPS